MKKVIVLIVVIVIIAIGAFEIYKRIDEYNKEPAEIVNEMAEENIEEEIKDTVIIKNGKIQNENLIDKFISDVSNDYQTSLTIYEFMDDVNYKEKRIDYYASNLLEKDPWSKDMSQFGYYDFILNNDEDTKQKYNKIEWQLKRSTSEGNVNLIFYDIPVNENYPIVCTYNLENSNYKKEVNMNFYQRKDKEIKKIIDKNTSDEYDFDIYTFGGDVNFTVDSDIVYDFQKALEEKVITIDSILKQAEIDDKYGICQGDMYSDGGTIEYSYNYYTILKYNTLGGNKAFVIGSAGGIRHQVDNILYK